MDDNPYKSPLAHGSNPRPLKKDKRLIAITCAFGLIQVGIAAYSLLRPSPEWYLGILFSVAATVAFFSMVIQITKGE
ncbi:MAG: hypothetical protein SGJ19_03700 [Planctomycetia bacterium]|nr:hypothetical protein [Planctomycetia bacterium]